MFVALVAGTAWVMWLDFRVQQRFDGALWALPAQVFARPLEIYPGVALGIGDIIRELEALGYRRQAAAGKAGTWSQSDDRIHLSTRGFEFWDGSEPALRLRIEFDRETVVRLSHLDADAQVPLVRLEPVRIGSISPTHSEDRLLVSIDDVPASLIDLLVTVEDRRFFDHPGIDLRGIARALWVNIRAGRVVQGGSTLTQQLVKNFFLTPERSLWRKVNEAVMALIVEARYEKKAILEAYINEIYLGQNGARAIHGFGLAAHFYFGRSLDKLKEQELALLVGMVKGPTWYSPRRNPDRARERRNQVLSLMAEQRLMEPARAKHLAETPLGVVAKQPVAIAGYPAFIDLLRRQLRRDYRDEDLDSAGLRIFSTLDPVVQYRSEQALAHRLDRLEKDRSALASGVLEGAVVVSTVTDGEVLAVVGGRRPRYAGFNRALDAVRQIGSLVKPAVYLTALQQKDAYSLLTTIEDAPLELTLHDGSVWSPSNFDRQFHGSVTLREALTQSLNVATVRLGLDLGVRRVLDTVRELGVQRPMQNFPSALLGSEALSPVEVTQMYQTLAAGGFYSPLRTIRTVTTAQGEALQRYPLTVRRVANPAAVFVLNTMLEDVTRHGTGKRLGDWLGPDLRVAGKTGSTNDLRDSWFAGFSEDRVATVWLGNDDNRPVGLTGSRGAMRVWADLMASLPLRSRQSFPPAGAEWVSMDTATGLLAGRGCSNVEQVAFVQDSVRPGRAPCYRPGERSVSGDRDGGGESWWQRLFR